MNASSARTWVMFALMLLVVGFVFHQVGAKSATFRKVTQSAGLG